MSNRTRPSGQPGEFPALTDEVYDHLVAQIMDGRVQPGQPLRTQAIASELGVSLTPVREALARLEPTGLVSRRARRGYAVAPALTAQELVDVLELRAVVEPYLAERACAAADADVVARLASVLRRQLDAPVGPDFGNYRQYLEADWDFHLTIARSSGNVLGESVLSSLGSFLQRYQFFEEHVVSDAEQTRAEHTAVVVAFRQGDARGAGLAMRVHLDAVHRRIRRQVASDG